MKPFGFSHPAAEAYVPDGSELELALARTTHLGIGAHPDDLELMAIHGILACFGRADSWFTGVVVTDGASSPRSGSYAKLSNRELSAVRRREQVKAALLGEYSAAVQLAFPSDAVKRGEPTVVDDLERVIRSMRPQVVYTHNLADNHDTHVAVTLRVIAAYRRLAPEERPTRIIGCEVWRDLDWLPDAEKIVMPLEERGGLEAALLGAFDSQLTSKRYDLAALGRRRAHATFSDSHSVDRHPGLVFGVDLTPALDQTEPEELITSAIRKLELDVRTRIRRLGSIR